MMAGIGVLTAIFYMFDMSDMEMRTSRYRITIHEPNLTSSYIVQQHQPSVDQCVVHLSSPI